MKVDERYRFLLDEFKEETIAQRYSSWLHEIQIKQTNLADLIIST